jgi:hypothetical protein
MLHLSLYYQICSAVHTPIQPQPDCVFGTLYNYNFTHVILKKKQLAYTTANRTVLQNHVEDSCIAMKGGKP